MSSLTADFGRARQALADPVLTDTDLQVIDGLVRGLYGGKELDREEAGFLLSRFLSESSERADVAWGMMSGAIMARGGPVLPEALGFLDAIKEYDPGLLERWTCLSPAPKIALTGSGKDWPKTVSISTMSAFVLASLGVAVVKPIAESSGNAPGSADVVRSLAIPSCSSETDVRESLSRWGVAFVSYARACPRFYARYTGRFPFVSPLSFFLPVVAIPVDVTVALHGLAHPSVELAATLVRGLDGPQVVVVSTMVQGSRYVDEALPCSGLNIACSFETVELDRLRAAADCTDTHLLSASIQPGRAAADVMLDCLSGKSPAPLVDVIAANVALGLLAVGLVSDADEAVDRVEVVCRRFTRSLEEFAAAWNDGFSSQKRQNGSE